MAISVSVNPGSAAAVTATERLGTINATVSASGNNNEDINSVSSTTHTGITMTSGTSSCTLAGTYIDSFTDQFTYVEKGSSNLAGSPTTVIGLDNLPSNKLFFNLNQDSTASVTKSYTVSVTYNEENDRTQKTETFAVTQIVNNEYDSIKNAVGSYYG